MSGAFRRCTCSTRWSVVVFVGEGRVLEYVPVHTSELPIRGRAAHPAGCGFSAATRVVVFSTGQTGRSRFSLVDVDSPFTRYYHVLEGRFDGRAPGETPSQTGQSKSAGWVQPTSRHLVLVHVRVQHTGLAYLGIAIVSIVKCRLVLYWFSSLG